MATRPEHSDAVRKLLAEIEMNPDQFPSWEDADDLARLHVQSFARRSAGGFDLLRSKGALRLTGAGVKDHSLDLAQAGELLALWQGLVTSTGAATEGKLTATGKLSDDIKRRTRLLLSASPAPGSVILEFTPSVNEADERYPHDGGAGIDGPQTPLVERSVGLALDVLDLASQGPPIDLESEFSALGPRVASRALDLATLASGSQLDLDFSWERPGVGRRRSRTTAAQLATFATSLKAGSLDTEPETLRGVLRTISDRKKIDLEIDDPESDTKKRVVSIKRGQVDFAQFHIGEVVQVKTTMRLTSKPGGREGRSYTAESVTTGLR